jgi:hypothetical protein
VHEALVRALNDTAASVQVTALFIPLLLLLLLLLLRLLLLLAAAMLLLLLLLPQQQLSKLQLQQLPPHS